MKTTTNNSQKIKKITIIGVFVAFAYAVSAILPIKVSFLTLDFKDVISTICGLFFGPIAGIVSAGIVPFIEMMTTSTTKFYGLIMNLISSLTFVGIASVIYKYKKTIYIHPDKAIKQKRPPQQSFSFMFEFIRVRQPLQHLQIQ